MTVAIKKISSIYSDTLSMKRILREINILRSINHPHIIPILEVLRGNRDEEIHRQRERAEWSAAQSSAQAAASAAAEARRLAEAEAAASHGARVAAAVACDSAHDITSERWRPPPSAAAHAEAQV